MPTRLLASKRLAELFHQLAHPDRIRLVEELFAGERDVSGLSASLGLPPTRVSQHLALLKARHIVEERRDGRHHFYHLVMPELARWVVDGLDFVDGDRERLSSESLAQARSRWLAPIENS